MAAPEVYSLAQGPITAHAFNQDRSRECRFLFFCTWSRFAQVAVGPEVAVSLNSKDVQIFSKAGNDWKASETLSEVRIFRPCGALIKDRGH